MWSQKEEKIGTWIYCFKGKWSDVFDIGCFFLYFNDQKVEVFDVVFVCLLFEIYWRGAFIEEKNNRFDLVKYKLVANALCKQNTINSRQNTNLFFIEQKANIVHFVWKKKSLWNLYAPFQLIVSTKAKQRTWKFILWFYHCTLEFVAYFVCCFRHRCRCSLLRDNFMALFFPQFCSASLFTTTSLSFISFNLLVLKLSPLTTIRHSIAMAEYIYTHSQRLHVHYYLMSSLMLFHIYRVHFFSAVSCLLVVVVLFLQCCRRLLILPNKRQNF